MSDVRYVRAKVTGLDPVRDVFTRESVEPGGTVTLLVRPLGTQKPPPCPRHPRKGANDPAQRCYCYGTILEALLEQKAIGDVVDFDPDAKPVKGKV